MSDFPHHIFREYDIRGVYGRELTGDVAYRTGRAFCALCSEKTGSRSPLISLGMDARVHSPELRDAFASGFVSAGGRWVDIGLCPSPLSYFSAFELDVDGFAMVTASHNPPADNGLKLGIGNETLYSEDIQRVGRMASEDTRWQGNGPGDPVRRVDIVKLYADLMIDSFRHLSGHLASMDRPVSVVVDSGNGTAGVVFPGILRELGVEVHELFSEPDGTFPNHHPDPTLPEALESLRSEIARTGSDLGVSFDGDADRLGVLDGSGDVIWGDILLLLLGRAVIERWKREGGGGEPPLVISEVKASRILYDGIEASGGRVLMWKTGHSLIKAKMRETGAAIAGEMSGHLFFADRYYGYDDALYGALRLLEVYIEGLAEERWGRLADLLADIPELHSTPEIRIPCEESEKFRIVEQFSGKIASHMRSGMIPRVVKTIVIDGIRVEFDSGWGLLRASNTQPVLVMRFEGNTPGDVDLYRGFFEKVLAGATPGH